MRRLKLISLLTCFLFLFSFTTTVFASEGDSKTKSVTVNEYEMLQSLSKNSTEQLAKLGYSSAEAKQIENYQEEYKNHLKKIAALDDELLKEMGYTSEQIEILRTYDGSEEATIILAATLNISVTAGSVTYYTSKNYTDASVSYSFSWSGEPLFKGTDIVGIAWNDWDLRSSSGKVTYRFVGGGATKTETPTLKNPTGPRSYGRGHTFPLRREYNITKDVYIAKSGTGSFNLRHSGGAKNLSVYAAYGHATISVSPSIDIKGIGSITFSKGINTVDEDWADRSYTTRP